MTPPCAMETCGRYMPVPPSYAKYWVMLGDPVEVPAIVSITSLREEDGNWQCSAETAQGPRLLLRLSSAAIAELGARLRELDGGRKA